MPDGATLQQIIFVIILLAACGFLITERLRVDVVAMLIVVSLAVTGILKSDEALAGFSSEPAIVIAAVFVLAGSFQYTGLAEIIGNAIGRLAGKSIGRMLGVLMSAGAIFSAFTHHVAITTVLLPVTLNLSRQTKVPPSKLLMPMAIASSMGTTLTVIAAPSFLLASELLRQAGRPGLGVFSITPIGLALVAAGLVYMLVIGRFLLPDRRPGGNSDDLYRLESYFTELRVLPESPLIGKTISEVHSDKARDVKVVGWLRNGRRLHRPFGERTVEEDDVLLVRTPPSELVAIREDPGVELQPAAQYESSGGNGAKQESEDVAEHLYQVIVAPKSSLSDRTLSEVDFRRRYGAVVMGLWRQDRFLPEELSRIKLRSGDTLVVQGDDDAMSRLAEDRDFLMMVPFQGEAKRRRKAPLAALIMFGAIVAVTAGWASLGIAMLAGAIVAVLTRCLTPRQAYGSIDVTMFMFIAGAIPLGTAMKKTGTAELLGNWVAGVVGGWNEMLILFALFAVVGLIVQFMGSDSATTAIFGPMAIALAQVLHHAPEAYVVTVAIAAVTAVLTPMSHHNLVIYGPGGYRFTDYFRVGAPLTLIIGAIVAAIAPMLWRA